MVGDHLQHFFQIEFAADGLGGFAQHGDLELAIAQLAFQQKYLVFLFQDTPALGAPSDTAD